ncbi:Cell cycle serine/threonine-protein kinase CDC5/MSD2 [Durusdinium trenchii]|uniref:Cell cycle serine/threonine-protein kinase CDC5/MSD2 n=1 Tax=Durusdinium trenchii TaxID=1381693 RepID=A0ABP0M6W4_9DINO
MPASVDVIADSDSDVAEVVDITVDSDDADEVAEVNLPAGVPPLSFHGYRRGRELGQGGSSQVFVCSKTGSQVGFAAKAVNLRRLQMSPDVEREWKKLCREVEIWKQLPAHPNIVQLVDSFQEGGWFLMVLELVGGGDLFTVLTSRPSSRFLDREAAFVGGQLAQGLAFLHGRGVVHRDVKLENVLVASQRRAYTSGPILYSVKITDFGLSRLLDTASVAQSTVGTHPYCAPEVLGEGSHNFSADVWCLGILLFVLLSGHFPFNTMPAEQTDLDRIIENSVGERAKAVLCGLLQLQPAQRRNLSELLNHQWFQEDEWDEQPLKRHRTLSTSDVVVTPSGISNMEAIPPVNGQLEECKASSPAFEEVDASPCDSPFPCSPFPCESPLPCPSPLPGPFDAEGVASPGVWTPFAVEVALKLSDVQPPVELQPDYMQVHLVIPDRFAGFILGKNGSRIQKTASKSGCKVWMTKRNGSQDRRVIVIGNYKQCKVAQQIVHEQLSTAMQVDWQDAQADVIVFVRSEAAGMVTGKQGFVLNQIRKQSGAQVQLLRDEVQSTRPCIISGTLQSILKAQKHIFELVCPWLQQLVHKALSFW